MSASSVVGAVLLALLGVGLGLVSLSVGYLGSFHGNGLAPVDALFVKVSAVASLVCIGGAVFLFASKSKQHKG